MKEFEVYFITHSLLADFQEKSGTCSMSAEEDLFYNVRRLLRKNISEEYFLEDVGFILGLGKRELNRAKKRYAEYRKD